MGDKHKIVPPPYRPRAESRVLEELPDVLGLVLWQALRHVRDWVETPQSRRSVLFPPQLPGWVLAKRAEARRQLDGDMSSALDTLLEITRAPLAVDPIRFADACQTIAEWSEQRQHGETVVQFAEMAAVVDASEARRANMAGRATRNAGITCRSEAWFERGIGLARQHKDRIEYTRGHLGAGILSMTLGREARARRHFNTASTVAMKEGHEWLAAEAQHDLFHFMTVRGNYIEAELHARRALEWYPKHHKRYPLFVADVAFLLVCERHFGSAVTLLRLVLRIVSDPNARAVIMSLFARALAGTGRLQEFTQQRRRVLKLLAKPSEWEPAARWNLAEAERSAGLWKEAERNARAAVELARARRDSETEGFASKLLQEIEAGVPAPREVRREDESFTCLLDVLITRLAAWSPTRRGRSPTLSRTDWAA